jgi:LysR family transcriptional regulator, hydrogen peroxide-inducible genes activator
LQLHQLRYFIAICEEGNMSRAAIRLFVAQPSLSEQVRKLEQELGTPLFVRLPRRLVLTPAGETFRVHATRILEEVDLVQSHIDEVSAQSGQEIRVGVLPTLGSRLFPTVIAEFRRTNPGVRIELREENSSLSVKHLLSERELDVGVLRLDGKLPSHLEASFFLREPLVALVGPGHLLARGGEVSLEEIAEEPFITLKAGYGLRELVMNVLKEAGVTPNITVEVSQLDFLIGLVEAGMGITMLPQLAVARERRVTQLQISDRHAFRELYLVWRKDIPRESRTPLRTFIEMLRANAVH